jgi:hypothetical protein
MDDRARLRVNLGQREFEVEGSEAFVREFAPRIESLLERLAAAADEAVAEPLPAPNGRAAAGNGHAPHPRDPGGGGVEAAFGSFGEYLLRLPSAATDVDRMLAAGYYAQQQAPDDSFTTADANKRLTEQGIKLGNPSQCVKQSVLAKRVFMVLRGRYRVSQHGRAHLRQLMGPIIPE